MEGRVTSTSKAVAPFVPLCATAVYRGGARSALGAREKALPRNLEVSQKMMGGCAGLGKSGSLSMRPWRSGESSAVHVRYEATGAPHSSPFFCVEVVGGFMGALVMPVIVWGIAAVRLRCPATTLV